MEKDDRVSVAFGLERHGQAVDVDGAGSARRSHWIKLLGYLGRVSARCRS